MKSSNTSLRGVWSQMKSRCEDRRVRSYKDYGGRGIRVCQRWHSYEAFELDMSPRPAGAFLDRIDNDGDYCPENCRWVTRRWNNRNTRGVRRITAFGRTQTIHEWGIERGVDPTTIAYRLDVLKMDVHAALIREPDKRVRKDNRMLTINGETRRLADWSKVSVVSAAQIRWRLKRGWAHEAAVFCPPFASKRGGASAASRETQEVI